MTKGYKISSISLTPQYNKSEQSIPMVKSPLRNDYAHDYERVGKVAYLVKQPMKFVLTKL